MTQQKVIKLINLVFIIFLLYSCTPDSKTKIEKVVPSATEFKPVDAAFIRRLHGQQIYVPIYSSIYNQYKESLLHMTGILSIRNTSFKESITIKKVDYYDTNGKLLKRFIDGPFSLGKMSSKDFVIPENDLEGGTGANFIVEWVSENVVSLPLVESIMLGTLGTKGFSFSSRGQEIQAH